MQDPHLKYQPVIYPDGTVSIHETVVDKEGRVIHASYEPVRLEDNSLGALEHLLRQVYRQLLKTKPITEEELDALMYQVDSTSIPEENEDDDNIIDLVDYFARGR